MAIVFTCGSVSIVSNKQSIYTRVILIVRGSPQHRAGRYTLYASPRHCRGRCDGQPQPASLAAAEADEAGPGAGRQLQANTSLQCVPSTRPRLINTSDTVGTVASDSEGPQSDTIHISHHAEAAFVT